MSSSLSNLSSVSSLSTPTSSQPWYRPNHQPARTLHLQTQGGGKHSHAGSVISGISSHSHQLSGYDTSTTAQSSRGSSSSSTDSLASWSSKEAPGGILNTSREVSEATDRGLRSNGGDERRPHPHTPSSHPVEQGRGVGGLQALELKRVRTLYACVGEHETELSFEPNAVITGVRPSLEPGWLEGTLEGKVGLVPENYVEFLS